MWRAFQNFDRVEDRVDTKTAMAFTQAQPGSEKHSLVSLEESKTAWMKRQVNEEEKLRKQHQRLENEKRLAKLHKNQGTEKRNSLQPISGPKSKLQTVSAKSIAGEQEEKESSSATTYSATASKLFDYEKSGPRSRRELMRATSPIPTTPEIQGRNVHGHRNSLITPSSHRDSLTPSDLVPHGRRRTLHSISTTPTTSPDRRRQSMRGASPIPTISGTHSHDKADTGHRRQSMRGASPIPTISGTHSHDKAETGHRRQSMRGVSPIPGIEDKRSQSGAVQANDSKGRRSSVVPKESHRDSLTPSDVIPQASGQDLPGSRMTDRRESVVSKQAHRDSLASVSKGPKIRNRYNQAPHLTQDINGKVTNAQLDTTNESQEVSPFLAVSKTATSQRDVHEDATEKKVNFEEKIVPVHVKSQKHHNRSITSMARPSIQVEETEEDIERLKSLYNAAIERVQGIDESILMDSGTAHQSARSKVFSNTSFASGFDNATLKELEGILKDARTFTSRKPSKEDHTRLDVSSNRAQKKRIEHLEKVLKSLKPEEANRSGIIDPQEILQCRYLRLSKSNIQTLEEMVRQQGKDPGIHAHKDVTDYNIWEGLKEERRDSLKP